MQTPVLQTHNLTKKFGALTAVNNLNLEVSAGQVFGLLGPNGSGKTTTLGMLLGVLNPTAGSFKWYEKTATKIVRQQIGAILEHPIFFPHLTARENLRIAATIKNTDAKRIDYVLDWVGLDERKNDKFKNFSLGMRQRMAIASALLSDPQVLILDEPTNGLDPLGIADIRGLISKIANEGKTIILASHLLDEVQKVCSDFAVLYRGNLIHTGNVQEELSQSQYFEIKAKNMNALGDALVQIATDKNVERINDIFQMHTSLGGDEINKVLMEKGIIVSELSHKKKTLENQFLNLVAQHDQKRKN